MNEKASHSLTRRPLFRVAITWFWDIPGAALTALLIVLLLMTIYHVGFSEGLTSLQESPYLLSYAEIVSTGLLPLILTVYCKEKFSYYGIKTKGLLRAVAYSLPLVVVILLLNYFTPGQKMWEVESFHLTFPWNIWYAAIGVFAYGPLEVFFVTWLIRNTDNLLHSSSRVLSKGLVITVILFGLLHVITSPTAGLANALRVMAEFFILGLIFKATGNVIGPMIAWSLINGQVYAVGLGSLLP